MNVSIDLNNKDLGVVKNNIKGIKPTKKDIKSKTKKPTLKERNPKLHKILKISGIVLLVLAISFGGYSGYKAYKFADNIGLDIGIGDIITPIIKDPELQRDSTETYTNILILGIDTRETDLGLLNTDTMIVASYNHLTNNITMISTPRDFFVPVPDQGWYTKINGIYSVGEKAQEGTGIPLLQTVLEEVLDMEIQYHAMIDLKGFSDAIDAVEGITVNIENSFTDYQYPTGLTYPSLETISFEQGPQLMDGETALKYARSRKSPDLNEGTDFARAKRQQNVLVALKDKLLTTETLFSPSKLTEILTLVQDNVTLSEFTLEDIQAGLALIEKQSEQEGDMHSFVLDPSIGDWQVLTDKGLTLDNAYVIGPKLGLGNYTDLHLILKGFLTNPELYKEEARILVYDTGLGYQDTYNNTLDLLEQFPFTDVTFMGTLYYDKTGVTIYNHSIENENPSTFNLFSQYLNTENITQPEYITTNLNAEDITIFFGAQEVILEEVIE